MTNKHSDKATGKPLEDSRKAYAKEKQSKRKGWERFTFKRQGGLI